MFLIQGFLHTFSSPFKEPQLLIHWYRKCKRWEEGCVISVHLQQTFSSRKERRRSRFCSFYFVLISTSLSLNSNRDSLRPLLCNSVYLLFSTVEDVSVQVITCKLYPIILYRPPVYNLSLKLDLDMWYEALKARSLHSVDAIFSTCIQKVSIYITVVRRILIAFMFCMKYVVWFKIRSWYTPSQRGWIK